MKRRVLSFIVTLALCLNLCPVWVLAAGEDNSPISGGLTLSADSTYTSPYKVSSLWTIDTRGYTFLGESTAIEVVKNGDLHLKGKVVSASSVGVRVRSGGSLSITEPGTRIEGGTYALSIDSDTPVQLSAGTYVGETGAIIVAGGNYKALLAQGCAYFDGSNHPLRPEEVKDAKTVTVGPCTEHLKENYTHNAGAAEHGWTCAYCGTSGTAEPCMFTVDQDGNGTCACGNALNISIVANDLVYDGAPKPGSVTVTVTVTLTDGSNVELTEGTHYEVQCETRTDVGSGDITVRVTSPMFSADFIKTYQVEKDQPELQWSAASLTVPYDKEGRPVDSSKFPLTIKIKNTNEVLSQFLEYSYRKDGETEFEANLPTDAGTYEIKASLPESQNYKAAETDSFLKLTIDKIDALLAAPSPIQLTYDGTAHALVTAGVAEKGAQIEYALEKDGPYSADIPAKIDAGSYEVWYRIAADATNYNYNIASEPKVSVTIKPKEIQPAVELSQSFYPYDGNKKEPKITVKDGDTVLKPDQYEVSWAGDLTSAGTHTVTITSTGKNYTFTNNPTAEVKISAADQNALTITGKRDHVYYGDTFTLGTTGGTADGKVEWTILGNAGITNTGELTVKGTGTVTVTAKRTVTNYETVSDTWTFTVEPKPVVAEVTVTAKNYDGTTTATVSAEVKPGDLVNGETITISGLTGTYDTPNAGTGKTVTLDTTNVQVTGTDMDKYSISYPAAVRGDITPKQITGTVELSGSGLTQEAGTYYCEYDGTEKKPAVIVKDGNDVIPDSEYDVSYHDNINFGTATVIVSNASGGNYIVNGSMTFGIRKAGQTPLSITGQRDRVYYGNTIQLDTKGGSGAVTWTVNGSKIASITTNGGLLTITGVGDVTVTATSSDPNHENQTAEWKFTAEKKPVTAILTAVDRDYAADNNTVTVNAAVPDSELVPGDSIKIGDLTGTLDNPDAGTGKKVTVDSTNPDLTHSTGKYTNYRIIYPATTTVSILKVRATATAPGDVAPTLTYEANKEQELITAGTATGGTMVYSLDGTNYSPGIPTGKEARTYTVYYKVQGDRNHTDSVVGTKKVTIAPQTVTPAIELNPPSAQYDGQVHQPAVVVRDGTGNMIPASEYRVTYVSDGGKNWTDKGEYTVQITDISGGNYAVKEVEKTFKITEAAQSQLEITGKPSGEIHYGDAPFRLSAAGTVTWTSSDENVAAIDDSGLVTIVKPGTVVITATRAADGNYGEVSASWTFTVKQKPVTPAVTVTGGSLQYTGSAHKPPVTVVVEGNTLGADEYATTYTNNINAGTALATVKSTTGCNYQFEDTVGFEIAQAAASVTGVTANTLTYNGSEQDLISVGEVKGGNLAYSWNGSAYASGIPKGKNADSYTFWYKVVASSTNYKDSEAVKVENVTISQATPTITNPTASGTTGQKLSELAQNFSADVGGSFAWVYSDTVTAETMPSDGSKYNVTFTPDDGINYNTVTFEATVTITDGGSTPSTPSGDDSSGSDSASPGGADTTRNPDGSTTRTQTRADGTKVETTTQKNGDKTVVETRKDGSSVTTVTQRDGTTATVNTSAGGRVEAEVNLPAAAVSAAQNSGEAVSLPIPEVTAVKSTGAAPAVTVNTGSESAVKVDIPMTDPVPGAVAVLVKDDGTEEIIKTSVPTADGLAVALSDGDTVKIVDNSKDFDDVPSGNWASDAIAFASARELFSGTSETTFSPDQNMSRGMLATVLYNLEGRPEQDLTVEDLTSGYSDVSGDAWYADGIAWAAGNGIVNGYGNGEFGPGDSITREQFAVMLWKYAGSPAASGQNLRFADADQASDYAREALCWAVEQGIMSGYTDSQLAPGGTATRAQAAQMLKNFIENA